MAVANHVKKLKFAVLSAGLLAASSLLSGCGTTTSLLECAAESMNPTVMAALDSFESASMAIRLSNKVLKDIPVSEWDEWPNKLYEMPDAMSTVKMGAALFGSTQGVTIPTEMDPETGFPRPTSALYIMLKQRDDMISKLNNKEDIKWFARKPATVIHREPKEQPRSRVIPAEAIDKNVYRNTLMAYGVVTSNKQSLIEMQQEINRVEKGYKTCTYFINNNKEENETKYEALKKEACPDFANKDAEVETKLKTRIVADKKEEKEAAEKAYGKLANKIYKASVAGADFSAAATTKLVCAVINGVRALPNIRNEFSGLKGAYNIATAMTRATNAIKSIGIFKDNIGYQWTVYKTMYQQIKGTYEIKEDEKTKEALQRIHAVELALAEIEPKLQLALNGAPVDLSRDLGKFEALAAQFPATTTLEATLLAAAHE